MRSRSEGSRFRFAAIGRQGEEWWGRAEARTQQGGTSMPKGTVKWFNTTKGYGFIAPDTGGKDIFVHISAVERSGMRELNEGDRLEFDIEVDRRGKYSAVNLVTLQG